MVSCGKRRLKSNMLPNRGSSLLHLIPSMPECGKCPSKISLVAIHCLSNQNVGSALAFEDQAISRLRSLQDVHLHLQRLQRLMRPQVMEMFSYHRLLRRSMLKLAKGFQANPLKSNKLRRNPKQRKEQTKRLRKRRTNRFQNRANLNLKQFLVEVPKNTNMGGQRNICVHGEKKSRAPHFVDQLNTPTNLNSFREWMKTVLCVAFSPMVMCMMWDISQWYLEEIGIFLCCISSCWCFARCAF